MAVDCHNHKDSSAENQPGESMATIIIFPSLLWMGRHRACLAKVPIHNESAGTRRMPVGGASEFHRQARALLRQEEG